MKKQTLKTILFPLLALAAMAGVALFFVSRNADNYTAVTPTDTVANGYVGSASCKQCHAKEYAEWTASDHYKAMQVANDQTVLGNFDNATYTADGITSRFYKKDGKYYINTQNEKGDYQDYEVLYTFGYYPLQQYITDFANGKKQVFRQSWDSREHKWFHQYAGEVIPPDDYLHWTQSGQNWNLMCASCHSTNLQKNLDPYTDSYHTTYDELTVGCEACHGGGKAHTESGGKVRTWALDTQQQELNACMPCHTRRGEVTQHHSMVAEVMDEYIPEVPVTELYFADGQVLGENYKYSSFLQSKMYHQGVRCTSCHLPHTGKLKAEGSKVCLQCHAPKYATAQHTFHQGNPAETDCRLCHQPTRTYMGNDVRHDHNFYVPRPDLTAQYGTPNACNACHTDKTAQWAANAIVQWYGKERAPHFAENFIKGSQQQGEKSVAALRQLLADKATPAIVRAGAVHYLGGMPSEAALTLIKKELHNPDPQTRYRAVVAIADYPLHLYEAELLPLLTDKVKAVRMVAANALLTHKPLQACQAYTGFEQAHNEYKTFVLSQADFPLGSATAGDYFVKVNDTDNAIRFYERALKKDKHLNYIRLNLATLYNSRAANDKAEAILKEAQTYEPKNAQIPYFLALLYSEQQRYPEAKTAFEQAMRLGMNDENIQRNYQNLLQLIN